MKKFIALILAALMMCLMSVPVMAATVTSPSGTGTTGLSYTVAQSFTVTIPESIAAGSTGTANVVLSTGAIIETGKKLTISVNGGANYLSGYRMKIDATTDYLAYDLFFTAPGETEAEINSNGQEILSVNAGDQAEKTVGLRYATATATIAGTYEDTLTFTVAISDQTNP